jgi:hypothetical protein
MKTSLTKQETGFETYKELTDWAKGRILIGVGEGDYRGAVNEVINVAIRWGACAHQEKMKP